MHVRAAAAALQGLGVRKGDRVLAWLPTGMPMMLTWFAANYLGAVFVPINTAYRSKVLEHVINNSGAAVMVAHAELGRAPRRTPPSAPQARYCAGCAQWRCMHRSMTARSSITGTSSP